jgi:calcineurin-like phosphoesterase family protein
MPQDTVYFLGDMVLRWGKEGKEWWRRIRELPGRKILCRGNHDHGSAAKLMANGGFETLYPEFHGIQVGPHKLLLSHVPMIVTPFDERYNGWRRRVREEFISGGYDLNVHGHTHERNTGDSQCANVSIENTQFRPVLLGVNR